MNFVTSTFKAATRMASPPGSKAGDPPGTPPKDDKSTSSQPPSKPKTPPPANDKPPTDDSKNVEDPADESEDDDDDDSDDEEEDKTKLDKGDPDVTGFEKTMKGLVGLNDDHIALLKELYLANGQDAYDAEAAAVGRLKQEEYLALPTNMRLPAIMPVDVGKAHVRDRFKMVDLAAVYFLNKKRAPVGENAIAYAMIRMEAVKMGWVTDQKEIIRLDFTDIQASIAEFVTDLSTVKSSLPAFRLAAFMVPLVCEHTFRTMGHHYISGMAVEYQTRYRKTLKACLSLEIMDMLQPPNLFHHVLHWVSPQRAFNVLSSQLDKATLPDALVIRASAPPAGWALVTTTSAVISAMESSNVFQAISKEFGEDLTVIREASEMIRADVRKYHKAYFAYGVAPPDLNDLKRLELAKEVAIKFAPYSQGFIDGTLKDAALGQAQALRKHAELNPVAKAKAARFFRLLARSKATTVSELFSGETIAKGAQEDDE